MSLKKIFLDLTILSIICVGFYMFVSQAKAITQESSLNFLDAPIVPSWYYASYVPTNSDFLPAATSSVPTTSDFSPAASVTEPTTTPSVGSWNALTAPSNPTVFSWSAYVPTSSDLSTYASYTNNLPTLTFFYKSYKNFFG